MSDNKSNTTPAPAKADTFRAVANFLIGGGSGMVATCFVQPIDMVKVRIQILAGENPGKKFSPFSVAKEIWTKEHGLKGFYRGIDSALMRQAVYTTSRFGLFLNISDYLRRKNGGENLSFGQKGIASLTAGGVASFVGNPCDLILIRMQADSTLPEG